MKALLARKIGMTRIPYKESIIPCTLLHVDNVYVLGVRTKEKDGYSAVKLCIGKKKVKRIKRPLLGELKKVFGDREEYPAELIKEIRGEFDSQIFGVGSELSPSIFQTEETVDVIGFTKGRGFSGVVKRWNFAGGPASHGSMSHRRPGSIGQTTDPGRVWKGKKMAGHYGNERETIHNLKVVYVDTENKIIGLKGSVPGPNGSIVIIRSPKRVKQK
ncbi:MAG: 50S ribosomal protein L3 [Candidatus Hydrothermales bacterium]